MVNMTINNQPFEVEDGLTIMEAARQYNINIPNLCYMRQLGFNPHRGGNCRICVVEVQGAKNLMASCTTKVREGMVVNTYSKRVNKARRVLYELMLSDHSQDCLSCTRNQSCEFQALGKQLGVNTARFDGERSQYHVDASVAITRDMSKCILCRRCVTACNDIQKACVLQPQNRGFSTEISPAMSLPIGSVNCTFCGQCTVVCPVGALRETSIKKKVWGALENPALQTVAQVAPAVRVAIGEAFGLEPGARVTGKLAAALRKLGFDHVFDTNFAADLTIMEEGTEFLQRARAVLTGGSAVLPMITSCSPGWIKFIEHHYAGHLSHLSTCKSPHTMLGAVAKNYYAGKVGVDPKDMCVVSVMPCTAKKFEVAREEMENGGLRNVDEVLTTRELADMIKSAGIDFAHLPDEDFDSPLGQSTGAADIFGLTGGVMEAALRTVYELVTGREIPFDGLHVTPIVGLDQVKEAAITFENVLPDYNFLEGFIANIAVTSGLDGAGQLMDQVAAGSSPYHFIEIMGCPGGCIMGGGQPRSDDPDVRVKRMKGLYTEDESKTLRKSHENPDIIKLYADFLGEPGGHLSHDLLHTHYVRRGEFNELCERDYSIDIDPAIRRKVMPVKARVSAAPKRERQEQESPVMLELEIENKRLKAELQDSKETVELLKTVLSDY